MRLEGFLQGFGAGGNLFEGLAQIRMAIGSVCKIKVRVAMLQALVTQRLAGLTLQGSDLATYFLDHVGDAGEVGINQRELVKRFFALSFVKCDAGRFFKDDASFRGIGRENLVDLTLQHKGIRNSPHPGIGEKALDVLESGGLAVDGVFAAALAIHPPRDLDFVECRPQLRLAIGKGQGHFTKRKGAPFFAAFKNNVLHGRAPQRLRALLTQNPANRIHNITFTAAVRAHHRCHAGSQIETGAICKTFESTDGNFFEVHVGMNRVVMLPALRD